LDQIGMFWKENKGKWGLQDVWDQKVRTHQYKLCLDWKSIPRQETGTMHSPRDPLKGQRRRILWVASSPWTSRLKLAYRVGVLHQGYRSLIYVQWRSYTFRREDGYLLILPNTL
jgi:hypothetical protein